MIFLNGKYYKFFLIFCEWFLRKLMVW